METGILPGAGTVQDKAEEVPQMRKAPPTKQGFDKLLAWLDPDPQKAGEKYNKIQSRLIRVFACFGCDAEELADTTINIVVSRIDWLIENYVGEPALYFHGVSRKVYSERLRKPPAPMVPPPDESCSEDKDRMLDCLEDCLEELTPDEKDLVKRYQEGEKQARIDNRTKLAEESGITRNALRIKVYRIHADLRKRVEQRLKEFSPD